MSRTFVPGARPLKSELNLEEILSVIHERRRIAQGDEDKAGSIDDASYYEGWREALTFVEDLLTIPEEINSSERV